MRVIIFGAGGRTGQAVVQEALAAGHQVTAFIHSAGTYAPPDGATVHEGDATDADAAAGAIAGHDAVIDTIGGTTPYKSGVTLERDAARAIITAMQRHGVRRLLVTSAAGVGDSITSGSALLRILVKTFLRGSTKDKAAMEQVVNGSGLDWTIARPAILTAKPATGRVQAFDATSGAKAHKIARADLAKWLVQQLDDPANLHRAVIVANT